MARYMVKCQVWRRDSHIVKGTHIYTLAPKCPLSPGSRGLSLADSVGGILLSLLSHSDTEGGPPGSPLLSSASTAGTPEETLLGGPAALAVPSSALPAPFAVPGLLVACVRRFPALARFTFSAS